MVPGQCQEDKGPETFCDRNLWQLSRALCSASLRGQRQQGDEAIPAFKGVGTPESSWLLRRTCFSEGQSTAVLHGVMYETVEPRGPHLHTR